MEDLPQPLLEVQVQRKKVFASVASAGGRRRRWQQRTVLTPSPYEKEAELRSEPLGTKHYLDSLWMWPSSTCMQSILSFSPHLF